MGGSHIEALQMNRSENVTHKLDEDNMNSVISGTYQGPELLSQKSSLASLVRDYIPASGQVIIQLRNWKSIDLDDNAGTEEQNSLYDDPVYIESLKTFLNYIGHITKEHDTQLILLYHPKNYDVDETGQLVFLDETYEWEIFQELCEENEIVLVSTKDEHIRMYSEDYVVPNGFSNTRLGSGHINKYGHTAMANVLYETIKDLED